MQKVKRYLSILLAAVLLLTSGDKALAAPESPLAAAVSGTAAYLLKAAERAQVGSVGGEWAVIGLARSGCAVPEKYYEDYYAAVEEYVTARGGILHERKYTEYSRVIIALTAIGKSPSDVAGYNLLTPLGDFDKTIWQGINGPIWVLLALDSGGYAMPLNAGAAVQATRQMYVDEILAHELASGGWSLSGTGEADPDITGMALQALSQYSDRPAVEKAIDRALAHMSERQDEGGGFSGCKAAGLESAAQMLVALCELGISIHDSRFVKNGKTILDHILSLRRADGSFSSADGGNSQLSFEQAFYALVSALRAETGANSLYRMDDALPLPPRQSPAVVLPACGFIC